MAKVNLPWKWLLVVILILAVSWGGYSYYLANVKIEPDVLLEEAIERTRSTDSYRYHVKVTLLGTDTGDNVLSDLNGEKSGQNFHIWGELAKEEIEVYQVGNTTYSRQSDDSRWMKAPGNNPFEQVLFMSEINPLASFDFSSYSELEYLGKEEVDGKKMHLLSYKPELGDQLLTLYFKDFKYKIWVDRFSKEISQAAIEGSSKIAPEGGLEMTVKFWDYNKSIEIKPPEDA